MYNMLPTCKFLLKILHYWKLKNYSASFESLLEYQKEEKNLEDLVVSVSAGTRSKWSTKMPRAVLGRFLEMSREQSSSYSHVITFHQKIYLKNRSEYANKKL